MGAFGERLRAGHYAAIALLLAGLVVGFVLLTSEPAGTPPPDAPGGGTGGDAPGGRPAFPAPGPGEAEVDADEVESMIQDVIFSRGPKGARRTGVFIGGRNMQTAMDMLESACEAMFPPFSVSVFADPSGAFTTAAAMVAMGIRGF